MWPFVCLDPQLKAWLVIHLIWPTTKLFLIPYTHVHMYAHPEIWEKIDICTLIKTNTSKFQFDLETVDEEPPRGNATAKFLLLFIVFF